MILCLKFHQPQEILMQRTWTVRRQLIPHDNAQRRLDQGYRLFIMDPEI